jgi:hypothetical protein
VCLCVCLCACVFGCMCIIRTMFLNKPIVLQRLTVIKRQRQNKAEMACNQAVTVARAYISTYADPAYGEKNHHPFLIDENHHNYGAGNWHWKNGPVKLVTAGMTGGEMQLEYCMVSCANCKRIDSKRNWYVVHCIVLKL